MITWGARLVGVLTVFSVLAPVGRALRAESWFGLPLSLGDAGLAITAVAGVVLILLAAGLRRHKRRAWQLAVGFSAALAGVHLLGRPHAVIAGGVALLFLVGLLMARGEFTARPDPVGRPAAAWVVAQLAGTGFLLGLVGLSVRPELLAGRPGIGQRAAHAALALVGVPGPVTFQADWLDDLTGALGLSFGITALLAGGYFVLRSAEPAPSRTREDERRLRELLKCHGGADSLGYFALRADKSVLFSPSGKAAVAYRVLAGVALAAGDPLGDVEAWPGAVTGFLDQCRTQGWVPATMGCSERGARVWTREGGLDALELGDEAVVEVASFSLAGREMRGVRQAVARVRRGGYHTRIRRAVDIPAAELGDLDEQLRRWRGDGRGFSMALSRLADPTADPDCVILTARAGPTTDPDTNRDSDPDTEPNTHTDHTSTGNPRDRDPGVGAGDELRGALQLVPWGDNGLSLDLMIRDPAVITNGVSELMIADLLAACPSLGIERVSLNFAVFRAALARGQRVGAGPVARLVTRLLRLASHHWQIETLYRFNARFDPEWVPRFLVFAAARDLPRITLAALEAEGHGGRPPALRRLLQRT